MEFYSEFRQLLLDILFSLSLLFCKAVKRELSHELDLAMDQVNEYKTAKQKKEEEVEELKANLERLGCDFAI